MLLHAALLPCTSVTSPAAPGSRLRSLSAGRTRSVASKPQSTCSMAFDRMIWMLPQTGSLQNLQLVPDRLQEPAVGQVRVQVHAVGLNFADVFTCLGLYTAFDSAQNSTPGLEFAGVIQEVGPSGCAGLNELCVGDKVMGVSRFGAYASYLNVPAHQVRKMPRGWSFNQGAAFMVQGLTALYGLQSLGDMKAGYTVLVHSAAGGVGLFAIRICAAVGATAVATVGSEAKVDFLLEQCPSLTRDRIIVRDATTFAGQLSGALRSVGAEGFDIVLDAVGGDYFMPGYKALDKGGRYVIYGAADWTPPGDKPSWLRLAWQYLRRPKLDPLQMIGENKAVLGFNLIWMFDRAKSLAPLLSDLQALNLPAPHIGVTFLFTEAVQALRTFKSGQTKGKVVLEVSHPDNNS